MAKYFLHSLEVEALWGYRDFEISFHSDITILIGPNGSGKTTLLTLLRAVLTGDIKTLSELDFKEVTLRLQSFTSKSLRKISVAYKDEVIEYKIGREKFAILRRRGRAYLPLRPHRGRGDRLAELTNKLQTLVPAAWLPVSRRLPIPDDEDESVISSRVFYERPQPTMESVDERLRELEQEVIKYRLRLDAQLSDRYKRFERQVLQLILYSPERDTIGTIELPTAEQKEQLLRAFDDADLLDTQIRKQIDEHFKTSISTLTNLGKDLQEGREDAPRNPIELDAFFIIPLINRTSAMVQFAQQLEKDREELFSPLIKFQKLVSEFWHEKTIKVNDDGSITVTTTQPKTKKLPLLALSSGEKQILILLTQALLWEDRPVVYVADEPELSLHIAWQAKLLKSILELGGRIQIIVATHSPDIVATFTKKVIELGRA